MRGMLATPRPPPCPAPCPRPGGSRAGRSPRSEGQPYIEIEAGGAAAPGAGGQTLLRGGSPRSDRKSCLMAVIARNGDPNAAAPGPTRDHQATPCVLELTPIAF